MSWRFPFNCSFSHAQETSDDTIAILQSLLIARHADHATSRRIPKFYTIEVRPIKYARMWEGAVIPEVQRYHDSERGVQRELPEFSLQCSRSVVEVSASELEVGSKTCNYFNFGLNFIMVSLKAYII